jgi:arylsulfatase A
VTSATFAAITGRQLPASAAPDSISVLSTLPDPEDSPSPRETAIHDTPNGALGIRKGPWKLIPIQGGGGFRWDRDAHDSDQPPGQLFNLEVDSAERDNLYEQHPEIVAELQALLDEQLHDRDDIGDFLPPGVGKFWRGALDKRNSPCSR